MATKLPSFDDECFFITPIGDDDSDDRRRADGVLKAIVTPTADVLGLTAVRADRIGEGGQVNLQVIEHVCRARVAVADLTGGNLNVYYEVGMRHATRLPLVLIADESEREKLPFDVLVQRTIFFADDMNGVAACSAQVQAQLEGALGGAIDSPVDAAVSIRQFQQGDAVERTLAQLVTSVDGLSRRMNQLGHERIHPLAIRDLLKVRDRLREAADTRDDEELRELCDLVDRPVTHIERRVLVPHDSLEESRRERLDRARRDLRERRAELAAVQAVEDAADETEPARKTSKQRDARSTPASKSKKRPAAKKQRQKQTR